MITRIGRRIVLAGGIVVATLSASGIAAAQEARLDPRWYAWIGCWQPVATDGEAAAGAAPTVCVTPAAAGSGVEVATILGGAVSSRERLDASGAPVRADRESCTGFTTAEWSTDGRRIYRQSQHTCAGGFERRSSGIVAISPGGDWIDVEGLAAGTQEAVRAVRYRAVSSTAGIPAEISAALEGQTFTSGTARMTASMPAQADAVVEAARRVGPGVVEAWLAEGGQGFAMELDARRLVELQEAGVPERVIDMMVALTYPEKFAISPSGRPGERRDESVGGAGSGGFPGYGWGYDPFGYGYGSYYGSGYGRYGYGSGYGYGRYYDRPVVIVRQPEEDETAGRTRGRMVNGTGYRNGGNGGSTSTPSSRPSSSGSSGGASSGSGSSGGGESTGRTAKPRS